MEEIIQKELSTIQQKDPNVKGILLTDRYGLSLYNNGVNKDAPAYVKAISECAYELKLDQNDEEPVIVIETEKDNIIIKDYQKFILSIYKKNNVEDV